MDIKFLFVFFTTAIISKCQLISEVDFVLGATHTGSYIWGNFIGLSVYFENIQDIMNNSLFQGYQLNSNFGGDWDNNFALSLKVPLGHKYNCTALKANITDANVTCNFQTQSNATYWNYLGYYVWNTANQPYWCMGYDMQGVNLSLSSHQSTFYDWAYKLYTATFYYLYCAELVDYGDKMVQRGYKTAYTPANFVKDIQIANYVLYQIAHSGPGVTQDAAKTWLTALDDFYKVSYSGHYTVRCVVFKDPTKMTIEQILSDNSSKYYLINRFTVNQTFAYTDFSQAWLGINDIKLTTGDGVDGMTNTFAAAIWALDISIQFALMNGWEIDFNHQIRASNFQSILGPAPTFTPSALYYGILFAALVRMDTPQIIIPSMQSYISSKIKAFGFTTGQIFKILLINKDTNATLKGNVLVRSQLTGSLKCITMEAPSLTSKTGITISGYNFIGGNATVNGTFKSFKIDRSVSAQGYEIPIKYAQVVFCQTADTIYTWPKAKPSSTKSENRIIYSISSIILLVFLLGSF